MVAAERRSPPIGSSCVTFSTEDTSWHDLSAQHGPPAHTRIKRAPWQRRRSRGPGPARRRRTRRLRKLSPRAGSLTERVVPGRPGDRVVGPFGHASDRQHQPPRAAGPGPTVVHDHHAVQQRHRRMLHPPSRGSRPLGPRRSQALKVQATSGPPPITENAANLSTITVEST